MNKSSQVTIIYIALFTTQIVSKQLYRDNKKNNAKNCFHTVKKY